MSNRHKAREQALQILYQMDLSGQTVEQALERFRRSFEQLPGEEIFIESLVKGVAEQKALIDDWIEQVSQNWKISRMAPIDRNILRLSAYELRFMRETPAPVVLNEAVEIAKKFGNDGSPQFVNGVLDTLSRTLEIKE
jgi:N utilization substance protein B